MKILLSIRLILPINMLLMMSCASSHRSLLYVSKGGGEVPFYYTNRYDEPVFDTRYQEARQFIDGLAAVKQNGKWGYINETGKTVIPFQFDWCSSFGEYGFDKNVALVKKGTDKNKIPIITPCPTALINRKGEIITPFYGFIYPIEHKLTIVNNGKSLRNIGRELSEFDGKWGCIDKKGKLVIPCIYDCIYPFKFSFTFVLRRGKWGVINEQGKEIIPCVYDSGYYKAGELVFDTEFDTQKKRRVSNKNYKEHYIYMQKDKNIHIYNTHGKKLSVQSIE